MTAKLYRAFLSLLLLFVAAKVVSLVSPEEVTFAKEEESVVMADESKETENKILSDTPQPGDMSEQEASLSEEEQDNSESEVILEELTTEIEIVEEESVDEGNKEHQIVDDSREEELETIDDYGTTTQEPISEYPQPMTIYLSNVAIRYENGGMTYGQSIIDTDNNMVSTWGGTGVHEGNDGLSTHFIGHNPGIFSHLFSLSIGSEINVTNHSGHLTTYVASLIWVVDNSGYDVNTGEDTWNLITGAGNGEAISLQTCIDDYTNLIVFAIAK